jgi:hypothetical protein
VIPFDPLTREGEPVIVAVIAATAAQTTAVRMTFIGKRSQTARGFGESTMLCLLQ